MSSPLRLGQYEVVVDWEGRPVELGRGNMGVTYRAKDAHLHREVALKVIRTEAVASPAARERFLREARAAASLIHPNVATVFQFGEEQGTYYYAMEFVAGENLDAIVKQEGALKCGEALRVIKEVTSALVASHEKGLIHRDIKPENLMVVRKPSGQLSAKVIDFGLAKAIRPDDAGEAAFLTNGFVGTIHFASPEQIAGAETDVRSDIYSLGATLWYLLTGYTVFRGAIPRVLYAQIHESPPFDRLNAPGEIVDLLKWMLAKDAADRPQTPAELFERIEQMEGRVPADARCQLVGVEESEVVRFTLQDLLRVRQKLALEDVVPILEKIADAVEEEWAEAAGGFNLRLNAILVEVKDEDAGSASEVMQRGIRDWAASSVAVARIATNSALSKTVAANQTLQEQLPVDLAKTCVPALARIAYELLGGQYERLKLPAEQLPPLAALNEAGNEILRRAVKDNQGEAFPSAKQFCAELAGSNPEALRRGSEKKEEEAGVASEPLLEANSDEGAVPVERSSMGGASRKRSLIVAGIASCVIAPVFFYVWGRSSLGGNGEEEGGANVAVAPRNFRGSTALSPFVNGLGMQFVVVSSPENQGSLVLFARTETTVAQYAKFVQSTRRGVVPVEFAQGGDHPAVNVSWEDAVEFCTWLTETERATGMIPVNARYRLPSDAEWSLAIGVAGQEEEGKSPRDLGKVASARYPWGGEWPPPVDAGNYADAAAQKAGSVPVVISGYEDGHAYTSPVAAFPPNGLGLYGMGGNASEWCEDWYDPDKQDGRTVRGGSWRDSEEFYLRSAFRGSFDPAKRFAGYGFRCVLEVPIQ